MIKDKKWFAFYSQTGTEIVRLSKKLGITPDCVVTNKSPGDSTINKHLLNMNTQFKYINSKPDTWDYGSVLSECDSGCVVTLHGWMRIIPEQICKDYEIYNLHPGLITKHPELKGRDPQVKAEQLAHDRVGVVIHRVTEQLDSGEVLVEVQAMNPCSGSLVWYLHDMAEHAWLEFFNKVLFK